MLIHTVKKGETLYSIGQYYSIDYQNIADNNHINLNDTLLVGQNLVIMLDNEKSYRQIEVNGYVFPNISPELLNEVLPYLTYLSIFSYHVQDDGTLKVINDDSLVSQSKDKAVAPIMVITNIGTDGHFSSVLISKILNSTLLTNKLIDNIITVLNEKKYYGINVDFEYVNPEDRIKYINFIYKLKEDTKDKYLLTVSLAPKTNDNQKGILYEAHDYHEIGSIADIIIIMTYEWGYSGGPARAVAPLNMVKNVLDYAITRIPSEKIMLGIPNYGYDWELPYTANKKAKSLGNVDAISLARANNQDILFDLDAMTPYFKYTKDGTPHEVWFEDAKSIEEKLKLVISYNLRGISYWTLNRSFPVNYKVLNKMFEIKKY